MTTSRFSFYTEELWPLQSNPRYPNTTDEWKDTTKIFSVHSPAPNGAHDYDLTVNPCARLHPLEQMESLLNLFPQDFEAASNVFTSVQWRLLFYLRRCSLAHLGQPDFNVLDALRQACLADTWLFDVPSEWLGSDEPSLDIALGMRQDIGALTADQAKAVWAVLAFAQAIDLEKYEVLKLSWWTPDWLKAFHPPVREGNPHATPGLAGAPSCVAAAVSLRRLFGSQSVRFSHTPKA